jgi:DNA polymerase/3'-5' exonuclease PolX
MKPSPIKHTSDADENPNADIIAHLQKISDHLKLAQSDSKDPFRVMQYRKAINAIRKNPLRIQDEDHAASISKQVGKRIAAKVS